MSPRLLSKTARFAGSSLLRLQSDDRLVELARAGHEPGFAAIVERYRAELLRYCERLVGTSRAEDVLQQTLLNAHLAMHTTEQITNLRAWLYRIAHNAAVSVLRGSRPVVALDEFATAPGGIHEDLEVRDRLHAALAAIAALPQPQRDALTLRAIEGRSSEEVATALGVTEGAARQHVLRARTTLRAAVSAITPYGLLVRFAMTGGGPGPELAAGAGAGIGAAKIAATFLAAGALAGGATQLPRAVHRHHRSHPAAAQPAATAKAAGSATSGTARDVSDSAAPAVPGPGTERHRGGSGETEHHGGGRGPGSSGSATSGGEGSDDSGSGHRSGDDSTGSGGSGSGDHGSSGSSGGRQSGPHDSSGDDGGSGSSGSSGDSGSGSSGGSGSSDGSDDNLAVPVSVDPDTTASGEPSSGGSGDSGSGSDGGRDGSGSGGSDDGGSGSGSGSTSGGGG
jgi:RNA polymerase sigma factor (sigma-70 family)